MQTLESWKETESRFSTLKTSSCCNLQVLNLKYEKYMLQLVNFTSKCSEVVSNSSTVSVIFHVTDIFSYKQAKNISKQKMMSRVIQKNLLQCRTITLKKRQCVYLRRNAVWCSQYTLRVNQWPTAELFVAVEECRL